jgi:hypothetical protein
VDGRTDPTYIKSLIVAPTYGLAKTINIPQIHDAFIQIGLSCKFVADSQRFLFVIPDLGTKNRPSEILVRSADNPMMIAGFEVASIWGDEAARWYSSETDPMQDAILQCEGRLRAGGARVSQFNLTFTHEGDLTSVYRRFEQQKKADHALYRSGSAENTHLPQAYIEGLQGNLTPELAKQYLGGYAANFRGSNVYESFDEDRNIDSFLKLDFSRPLQLAIDFNIDPGCHVEIGQHFPAQNLVTTVYEIYEPRLDVKRLIPILRKLFEKWGMLPTWKFPGKLELFGDASGGNENAATGESCWQIMTSGLQQIGVPFTLANVPSSNPHVADRVNVVNCAFFNAKGEVRYKAHPGPVDRAPSFGEPGCPRLVSDWKTMRWTGNELDKRDRKKSHASDGDGYRIFQLLPIRKIDMTHSGRFGSVGGI